jgi:predicted XRE-type DNA-binding protein
MKTTIGVTMTPSGGDVFEDLGFSPAEARNLRLRAQLMTALREFIENNGLTQSQAAKQLKVTQPRISDLIRGKLSRFSLDALVNMITDAGLEVEFQVKAPSRRVA